MEVWNKRDLPRPPIYTIEYTGKERRESNFDVCVQSLLEGILCGHAVLCDEEVSGCFFREVAILTVSLFQNGRHRSEKFYKALKKVEKCSERWKELNFEKILDDIRQLMPAISPSHRSLRMPSKQMFEYLLIKILGGFHLLLHMDGYCREAAGYLMSKISSGHFFSTAMAFLANVARLRVLVLDLSGQLAKLYDDIFPWIQQLKNSSAPGLATQGSIPLKLSDYLQEYCGSLNEKSSTMFTKYGTGDGSFSWEINIFTEDDNRDKTSSCLLELPDSKTAIGEVTERVESSKQSKRPLVMENNEEDSKTLVSLVSVEDIGVCVTATKKILKHSSGISNDTKKRKKCAESWDVCKTGTVVSCGNTRRDKLLSVNVERSMSGLKREREAKVLGSNKKSKNIMEPHCVLHMNSDSEVSSKFLKHYQSVSQHVKQIDSIEAMSCFLLSERKRRCNKDNKLISSLLKDDDWVIFHKFIKRRIRKIEELRNNDYSACENFEVKLLQKTKTRLKFWLLFPQLKGKKPRNWKCMLYDIRNKKK